MPGWPVTTCSGFKQTLGTRWTLEFKSIFHFPVKWPVDGHIWFSLGGQRYECIDHPDCSIVMECYCWTEVCTACCIQTLSCLPMGGPETMLMTPMCIVVRSASQLFCRDFLARSDPCRDFPATHNAEAYSAMTHAGISQTPTHTFHYLMAPSPDCCNQQMRPSLGVKIISITIDEWAWAAGSSTKIMHQKTKECCLVIKSFVWRYLKKGNYIDVIVDNLMHI